MRKFKYIAYSALLSGNILNAQEKPNFLIIMTDQQRWDAVRASGCNDIIRTPNLDRLFGESVYFRQAVSPCPVSGPARTAMFTGRFIETTGFRNNRDAENDSPCCHYSYDQLLAKAGYKVEYYGKFHSPSSLADSYSNESIYGYSGPSLILEWETLYRMYLAENTSWRPQKEGELFDFSFYDGIPYTPSPIDRRYGNPTGVIPEGELKTRGQSQSDQHGVLQLDTAHTITAVQARQTIAALERMNRNDNFAITCSFHCPHPPTLPSEPFAGMYDAADMPVPSSIDDQMEESPYASANGRLNLHEYADPDKIRYMIAEYYASVSEIDFWVGRILAKLEDKGLDGNTIVIFASDHGEMLGSHGMRAKNIFLEESVRVPLAIRVPGVTGRIEETPVSAINICPTVLDYAGIDSETDGFSLKKGIEEGEMPYDFAVSEWDGKNRRVPNIMIRTKDWKLMLGNSTSTDALYDLVKDPAELHNLLGPSLKTKKTIHKADQMKRELVDYLEGRGYRNIDYIKNKQF